VSNEVVFYRADIQGLKPGDETLRMFASLNGHDYTYATTSLDVARAFAVSVFGVARDHERSVYRVQLDDPIVLDPEFRSDEHVSFVMSHWGTVLDVVEEKVTMTTDQVRRVLPDMRIGLTSPPSMTTPDMPPCHQNGVTIPVSMTRR
jgi:hypothetical protein